MAKSKKAAAAATLTITADCVRDSFGMGALPFVDCDRQDLIITTKQVSELKAKLLAAGFETLDYTLVGEFMGEAGLTGFEQDHLANDWEDGSVVDWDPRYGMKTDREWAIVAVLETTVEGEPAQQPDAVAILARPANVSAPWPFPKTEGGGPEVHSEPVLGDVVLSDGTPATITANTDPETAPAMTKSEAHLARKTAQFEILEPTDALLKTFTPRVEKHGEDDVSAASLGLQIEAPNTILDLLSPSLRPTLYAAPEGQVTLPGIVETMPLLRTKVIETLKLTNCYEGWTLRVSWGFDDAMTITKCKVDKFVVTPRDGGSVTLDLRVGSSDISEDEAGWLYGHLRHEIEITLHAPEQKPDAIDGTQAAFERDHPDADDGRDAGDLFAEQHGHQSPDDDQARDEGGGETETEGAEA